MSKQAEADLILKLYELRRDPTMRQARNWFSIEFFPQSAEDVWNTMFSEHSAHMRMVLSYWEMAAALVHHGAISLDLFNDTCGECYTVFSRLEPLLPDVRAKFGPQYLAQLERLVDATPNGRQRSQLTRESMKAVRAQIDAMEQQNASQQR